MSAASSAPATDAGNNVLGEAIRRTYGTIYLRACRVTERTYSIDLVGRLVVCRNWNRPDYSMGPAQEQGQPTASKGMLNNALEHLNRVQRY